MVPAKITPERLSLGPLFVCFRPFFFLSLMLLQSNSSFLSASLLTLDGWEARKTGWGGGELALIGFHSVLLIEEGENGKGWGEPFLRRRGEKGSADGAAALAGKAGERLGSAGFCEHQAICK